MVKRTYSQRDKQYSAALYAYPAFHPDSGKRYRKDSGLDGLHFLGSPANADSKHSIHGSMHAFASLTSEKKEKERKLGSGKDMSNDESLPSPHTEVVKFSRQREEPVSTQTAQRFESAVKRQPSIPMGPPSRLCRAERSPVPCHTMLRDRLQKQSKEALLWADNQTRSPLLRLPGEIRSRIYEYALGGNTIVISFETYRKTFRYNKPHKVIPVFRYHCTVFDRFVNPFRAAPGPPHGNRTNSFGVLSGICRQLYLETDILPFMLNVLCFSSHNVMFNMLFMEKRFSRRQRDAIIQMILPDALPQGNTLTNLPSLEQVMLACNLAPSTVQSHAEMDRGWYGVVRREDGDAQLVYRHNGLHRAEKEPALAVLRRPINC